MNTDFTLVLKTHCAYPMVSMAYRTTYFDPTLACSVYNFTRNFWQMYGPPWGWDGIISGNPVTTMGSYAVPDNYLYGDYKRVGEALTIKYGTSAGSIGTTIISRTCGVGDFVACNIGCGGGGTFCDILSFNGTPATPP